MFIGKKTNRFTLPNEGSFFSTALEIRVRIGYTEKNTADTGKGRNRYEKH